MVRVDEYELPDDLYYNEDHLWVRILPNNRVMIGLDDFGAKMAGDIDFVELPEPGTRIEKGQALVTLESGKWVGRLRSPLTGVIEEINEKVLDEDPRLINRDPYGEGWLVILRPEKLEEELKTLIHGREKIEEWLRKEIEKYKR